MRHLVRLGLVPALALAACSDDATGKSDGGIDAPANAGFFIPTAVAKANLKSGGAWMELGDADWSCLDTPTSDQPSTGTIALSGTLADLQTGDPVGAATITALPGNLLTANLGMATSSNVAATRGQYALNVAMLPAGQTRVGFKIEAAGYKKTYLLGSYLDPAMAAQTLDVTAISDSTVNAFPAFIGVTVDTADGMIAGRFRDCAGHEVSNVVATASSTSGTMTQLPGADTYYESAAAMSLPVRHSISPTMNKDGLFVVLSIKPQTVPAFVQIWGFTTAAGLAMGAPGLQLLAELPTPIEANAFIMGELEPRRR